MKNLFYRGQYNEILKSSVDSKTWIKTEEDIPYIIGALSFTGRMEEARLLSSEVFARRDISAIIKTRFFLGLGFTRLSDYQKANVLFAKNLNESRRHPLVSNDLFFIFQGVSFYRYYCGKYAAAKKASDVAFAEAFKVNDLYGKVLATDIRGHILIQRGETSTGFELLARAESMAEALQNNSIVMAIQISRMNYRARLGLDAKNSLRELFKAVATLSPQDNYSRAGYLLELSRQLTLRGRITEAIAILDRASESIYAQQNRRQEATLNLRYSHAMYCTGEYSRSLSYIRSAKRTLHPKIDKVLEDEARGLELKVVRQLNMRERVQEILIEQNKESVTESPFIHQRIMTRGDTKAQSTPARQYVHQGADPLGDLLDLLKTNPIESLDIILRDEYLGLLYEALGLERQRSILYIDLKPGLIVSLAQGQVIAMMGLTNLHRRIFKALAKGPATKEILFSNAWGIKYDPLRHDTVIYAAITSIRKLLGEKAHWLETTENGYRWRTGVEVISHSSKDANEERPQELPADADMEPNLDVVLNYRQIKLLHDLRKSDRHDKFINVQEYKNIFGISDITASRDLSALTQLGYMIRIGRARATHYKLKGY